MIRSRLFRKHFAIAALSVLGFVLLGSIVSVIAMRQFMGRPPSQSPQFFGRIVEEFGPKDPMIGIKKLESIDTRPFRIFLLDEKGELLYAPPGAESDFLAREAHRRLQILPGTNPNEDSHMPPGTSVIRLHYEPARYLFVEFDRKKDGPPPPHILFPIVFAALVIMVLIGVAFALFLIFRSLNEHVDTADHVIGELQKGNLKARFPTVRNDEIGAAMARFNRMAEEIEKLVERLRAAEQSRNFLLQDLAHDLRTPVASIKNLLETVFGEVEMKDSMRELADLSVKEIDYISRLVEDLLLLAQVSEPMYRPAQKITDILALVEEEAESLELRYGGKVKLSITAPGKEILITGDERLLVRLVRNALENAFSFASGGVAIEIAETGGRVELKVRDDGPGFSPDALEKFGERRSQRTLVKTKEGRLSLGLGSVIMKAVVGVHRGDIQAANPSGGGGEVRISLPLKSST